MAFTVEQLNALKPEGFEDEKWAPLAEGFMKLHNDDTNGLVNNEKTMKQEKIALSEKLATLSKAFDDSKKSYEEKISGLNKQLSDNSPESIKKIYESKITELNTTLENSTKTFADKDSAYQKQIAELTQGVFQRDCMDAFEKAIQGKNIDTNSMDAVRQLVMGDGYSKFARHDVGGGKAEITNNETGKNIATSVEDFLATPTGKHFVLSGTTGGGAEGSKGTPHTEGKTMPRATYESLPSWEEKQKAVKEFTIV